MREWLKLVEKLASRVFFPKPPQSNFSVRFAGIAAGCLLRCGAGRPFHSTLDLPCAARRTIFYDPDEKGQFANPVMLIVL